jgi:hypothetical protein
MEFICSDSWYTLDYLKITSEKRENDSLVFMDDVNMVIPLQARRWLDHHELFQCVIYLARQYNGI